MDSPMRHRVESEALRVKNNDLILVRARNESVVLCTQFPINPGSPTNLKATIITCLILNKMDIQISSAN